MLRLSEYYLDKDIMSLQVGAPIGHAYDPIINPANLKIEGWFATERNSREEMILPVTELRDVIAKGFVVNDHSAITNPEDLVRLKKVINLRFQVVGKSVKTDQKRRLGKVTDYTVNDQAM